MLIHDSRRNQTKVINFQGSAPKNLTEAMGKNASDSKVFQTGMCAECSVFQV